MSSSDVPLPKIELYFVYKKVARNSRMTTEKILWNQQPIS
jgi:hypothetical protein